MAERILTLPGQVFRRLAPPAGFGALGALLLAAVNFVVHRTRQPAMPRMSEEWLRMHDRDTSKSDEWGGFR